LSSYRFEPLGSGHNRTDFSCGVPALDDYLQRQGRQDMKRLVAAVFVMVDEEQPAAIIGYYTLSATSVALEQIPDSDARRLPRYPSVPATILGRLAREMRHPGTGRLLLQDAMRRAVRQTSEIGAAMFVVDAKDERARRFYEEFGFKALPGAEKRLYLPMQTIAGVVG
jgi:predicted GNAT family N-acyltransferase